MASSTLKSQPKKKPISLFVSTSFLFILFLYLFITFLSPPNPHFFSSKLDELIEEDCTKLHDYPDSDSKCLYIKTQMGCRPKGYINYLQIFYCTSLAQFPPLGLATLFLWLVVLFYLLANTAANYFCSSLETLSKLLNLSPTFAGVTLLSLGNGAPDVFASIVSFIRSGNGDFGMNSILGGSFVISSTVVGIISILISPDQSVSVDKVGFIRNVLFLVFALVSLLIILVIGKINLWGAIFFVSIYIVYVCLVSTSHLCFGFAEEKKGNLFSEVSQSSSDDQTDFEQMGIPLLSYVDDEKPILVSIITSNITTHEDPSHSHQEFQSPLIFRFDCNYLGKKLLYFLELPLELPRRLTIPVVSEEKWSKPFAVMSVTLAPLLVAFLCTTQRENVGSRCSTVTYLTAAFIGIVLGNLAYGTTRKYSPPKTCLLPWLVGGFLMCVTWTYIIAEELVSLLVSLGFIFGINPTFLGLTVLAWGNSIGDLITNVAMALNGGPDGVQIAISGCYAGPLFNILVGLGLSLVFSSWSVYPHNYSIQRDNSLYETVGFLMGGLFWALVILPKRNMKMDRFLGIGLLAIYSCFLFLRLAMVLGFLKI